jgi:hypothetical protein
MADNSLIQARKRAEQAVRDMEEGPLKIAAFQTILTKLLADSGAGERFVVPIAKPKASAGRSPRTLSERILALKAEGFFAEQQSLSDIRAALGSKGYHYPLTTLSGAMQGLVRKRELRRERVAIGGKQVWKYSDA